MATIFLQGTKNSSVAATKGDPLITVTATPIEHGTYVTVTTEL